MKRTLLIVLCAILCFACLIACGSEETAAVPQESAVSEPTRGTLDFSSFTAEDFDGNFQSGNLFKGHKLTMINIWGTFCGPCIKEMPDLETLSQSYGDEFQIIGIPVDIVDFNCSVLPEKRAEADAVLAQTGVTYLQLIPSHDLKDLYLADVQIIPVTLFFDENGVILDSEYYGRRSFDDWKLIIDGYLEALQ